MTTGRIIAIVALPPLLAACTGTAPGLVPRAPAGPPPGLGAFIAVDEMGPVVPVEAEGAHHLFYEFRLTSFDPRLLELDSLEVLDGDLPSNVLARYGAAELRQMIEIRGPTGNDRTRLHPGSHAVVYVWLRLTSEEIPRRLRHRLLLHHGAAADRQAHRLTTDPVRVSDEPPLVIAPPLRGGPWYAHAGPASASHHRRLLAPRDGTLTNDTRFASDWLLLEERVRGAGDFRYAGPDWTRTSGSEVFSVADGVVVAAVDGLPDDPISRTPRADEVIDWHTIGGNRITVALGDGRYASYQHLRPGSLTVQQGDTVRGGQLLGAVGNSGNSGAPHLHFDITDSEVLGKGEGLPFVFDCFDLLARAEPMPGWPALLDATDSGRAPWQPPLQPPAGVDRRRTREIPLGGAVVVFPEACGEPAEASFRRTRR